MNKGWCAIDGLNQIGFEGIFENQSQGTLHLQITDIDWGSVVTVANHDAGQAFLQVLQISGQAKDGHDFRGNRNIEAIFTGHSVQGAAQANGDLPQGPIVQIHNPFPDNAAGVDSQFISLMKMIVNQG